MGGLLAQTDLEEQLNMVALNCAGTIHTANRVVQAMLNQECGRILFTASIAGEMVAPVKRCTPQLRHSCCPLHTACAMSYGRRR